MGFGDWEGRYLVTLPRPEFHLQRINNDGTSSSPRIYRVHQLPIDATMNRRCFIGAGVTAGSVLSLLAGCGAERPATSQKGLRTPTPKRPAAGQVKDVAKEITKEEKNVPRESVKARESEKAAAQPST